MYGLLHYRGDVTALAVPGRVLGQSAMMIPYEVIDSEYDSDADRTTVNLQHASADTMRRLIGETQALYAAPVGTPPPRRAMVSSPRQRGKKRARR